MLHACISKIEVHVGYKRICQNLKHYYMYIELFFFFLIALTTVEGVIQRAIDGLSQDQVLRKVKLMLYNLSCHVYHLRYLCTL